MTGGLAELRHYFGDGPGTASLLVALIALSGAVGGALTSSSVAARAVYINSITSERSKWIEKLRSSIAAYSSTLSRTYFRVRSFDSSLKHQLGVSTQSILSELDELNRTAAVIQLQLNPFGTIDKNILMIIETIIIAVDTPHMLLDQADKLLVAHSQWLLKAEWEKVKYEAKGLIYRVWHWRHEIIRLRKYELWTAGEGSLSTFIKDFQAEKQKMVGRGGE